MEAERRRRLEGRDADRRLHDAIPGLAGLLPRRAEAEWTRADRVDALNRGHPTLCAGGIGEDGEHTLRTRGDHRGSREGHTAASGHPGNKPCGPTVLSTAGRGPTNLDISAVYRTPSEGRPRMLDALLLWLGAIAIGRSEERRVGEEGRSRWS